MIEREEKKLCAIECIKSQGCSIVRKAEIGEDISIVEWEGGADDRVIRLPNNRIHHSIAIVYDFAYDTRSNSAVDCCSNMGKINSYRSDRSYEWWCRRGMNFTSFYFKPKILRNRIVEIFGANNQSIDFRDSFGEENLPLINLLQKVILPLNWDDHIDKLALSHASSLMLYLIIKEYVPCVDKFIGKPEGLSSAIKIRVEEFIHENLDEQLTIDKLASIANLSSFHFLRMFKISFGATPRKYLIHKRLERAQKMLREPSSKILDVALECGFSSQSHFTYSFKREFGLSPNRYKKQI